jgi:glycosyltransferase involved in cell wall biosynthesis
VRIGVNALYMIPGAVGGTEIYLRSLLAALAEIDPLNEYVIFTNRETAPDLAPKQLNFSIAPQAVRAVSRPSRLLWEQAALPLAPRRMALDVMFNPGFTAPFFCPCPQVTVFHDLQHKRHPEFFRWFDLPFWQFFLYWSAQVSSLILADSNASAADLKTFYRLPPSKIRTVPLGVDPAFFPVAARRAPERFLLAVSTLHPHRTSTGCCAHSRLSVARGPTSSWWFAGCTASSPGRCTICANRWACGTRSSSPDGCRARPCTISTRARGASSSRRCSRASDFRFWKRWQPGFRQRAPRLNLSPALPETRH